MAKQVSSESSTENTLTVFYRNCLRSPVRKKVALGVCVFFVLCTTFICAYVFLRNAPKQSKHTVNQSTFVPITGINPSIDPCSNFYEFTCGLWRGNQSENNSGSINSFSVLGDLVRKKRLNIFKSSKPSGVLPRMVNDAFKFYNGCLDMQTKNSSNHDYLLNFLEKMGGWPILDHKSWNENDFNWIHATSYLLKAVDLETAFGVRVSVDDVDSSVNVLYITPPQFEKPQPLLSDFYNQQMLFTILYTLNSDLDENQFVRDMNRLVKVEALWKKTFSNSKKTEPVRVTLRDLQIKFPQFDWLKYIHLIVNDTLVKSGGKITEEDFVMVDSFEYIEKALSVLQSNNYTKTDMANLFGWFAVQDLFVLIPGVLLNYGEDNQYDLQETMQVAEDECFKKTLELYECGIDYLYVQNTSDFGIADSKTLVHYLKKSFKSAFSTSSWLEESTRNEAILKLNALQTVLGFKDYLKDKEKFENIYKDFPSVSENSLETYFRIKEYFVMEVITLLTPGYDMDQFLPRPVTDVSAYYIMQRNVLAIPISLYSSPFYYKYGPWYLNFGALGTIIGHEIMHAFDNRGCRRGERGDLKNWWTDTSSREYKTRSECFQNQYASYHNTSDGVSTLDENIADSEGLRMAYLAYKLWGTDNFHEGAYPLLEQYSPEQMFFISFGTVWCSKRDITRQSLKSDVHSSPELRVIGAISNSEYFARAFGCPRGSPMNPDNKCHLW